MSLLLYLTFILGECYPGPAQAPQQGSIIRPIHPSSISNSVPVALWDHVYIQCVDLFARAILRSTNELSIVSHI